MTLNELDKTYWNERYLNNTAAWDLGAVSPPLKNIIDQIKDKNLKILIPGAGNAYEATYLLDAGFTNVHVIDIAPEPIKKLQSQYPNNPSLHLYNEDFFHHQNQYDIILEQTFFCALSPALRLSYIWKMHHLLSKSGFLSGVLFNKIFDGGPPFGGTIEQYQTLFEFAFNIEFMTACEISIAPRAGNELLFKLNKKEGVFVTLYSISGLNTIEEKFELTNKLSLIPELIQVIINDELQSLLIVSKKPIAFKFLELQFSSHSNINISQAYS